ncbi:hypothetical protein [Lentibacillus saliphilus]|uniref:hypothetical protein n=1 Tax=Lentibacillus saliphilus TaxID=2737028 RepID=UPI001C305087|nr:hypothetical protein [Lentibacillus saliphilus]
MDAARLKKWSLLCFVLCILIWIPNIVFSVSSPLWLLVYIVGPIGIAFGALGKSIILPVLNVIMTFSFYIVMFLGYLFES